MRHTRKKLKYSPASRRMQLDEIRCWPVVRAALILLAVAAVALTTVTFAPRLFPTLFAGDEPSETVQAAPEPSAAPVPMEKTPARAVDEALQTAEAKSVLVANVSAADVLCDPYPYQGTILFASGTDTVHLTKLLRVDPVSGISETLDVPHEHDTLRNPCEDKTYVAWLDAKATGGGTVCVLEKATGKVSEVCSVAFGMPKLILESPYLAFCERISADATRLSVWNLKTGETVAPALFTDAANAAGAPCIEDGVLYFADAGADDGATPVIRSIRLSDGGAAEFSPGTSVYDPRVSGTLLAWLSGAHGEDDTLYWQKDGQTAGVARGVVDFALMQDCLVYCRDATVYAVTPEDGRTFVLSGAGSKAQLAAAGDGLIVWRDLTDPDRPVWKYVWLG